MGGLEETRNSYVMAFNYDGVGGYGDRTIYFQSMIRPAARASSTS